MQKLLTSFAWAEISRAAASSIDAGFAASAYFGEHGDKLLPMKQSSILVVDARKSNVQSGIVSPGALIRMKNSGVRVFTASNLHAKTYVFGNNTFVGSCNASSRSVNHLIESCLWTDSKNIASSARDFISSIALNELSSNELEDLKLLYKPPKFAPDDTRIAGKTLIMELLQEQGGSRASQVQPPRSIWENYFGIPWLSGANHKLRLNNSRTGEIFERPVVTHDHNMTIELSGAQLPRPAILVVKKSTKRSFSYSIYRPKDRRFAVYEGLLQSIDNPLRTSVRRWIAI